MKTVMDTGKMGKVYKLLLSSVLLLFLLLFMMLCWNSRLATDDYSVISHLREVTITEYVYTKYIGWIGRFAAVFVNCLVFSNLDINQTYYFLFPLISFLLLVIGLYKVLSIVIIHLNYPVNYSDKLIAAFSFTGLFFFLSFDYGEFWFWYVSLASYLLSIVAFVWGVYFLFSSFYLSLILSIVCFIYVGGASEVYSLIYGILFSIFIYSRFKKQESLVTFVSNEFNRKILIVFLFFCLSFLITVVAPGNYARSAAFPKTTLVSCIPLISWMFAKLFFWFLPQKLLYIVAFSSPFVFLGQQFRNSEKQLYCSGFLVKIKKITFLLLFLISIVFVIIAGIMNQSGEYRVWQIISFIMAIYISALCFCIGYKGVIPKKQTYTLKIISLIVGFGVMSYSCIRQYSITGRYSRANDERIEYLIQLKKKQLTDTLIILKPLPSSGMLYSSEISTDTNHFTNREVRMAYNLKYHVVSEKKAQ